MPGGVQLGTLRWETHLDRALVASGRSDSARKGLAVGEGKSRWLKRGCSAEVAGLKGLTSGALSSSIPARTEAKVLGQLRNSQGGCCCGPSGCRGRAFPGPRTPRGPIPRLCPAAPRALPAAWRWQCSPRPSQATGHPLRDRGDHRPGASHRPPLFGAASPIPQVLEKCRSYLPRLPPPSRRRYPWRLRPCPAPGRAAGSRPSGCSRRLSERWG